MKNYEKIAKLPDSEAYDFEDVQHAFNMLRNGTGAKQLTIAIATALKAEREAGAKVATGEKWMLRLAAMFLEEYSERLSNDGCNDFEVPKYVPAGALVKMIQAHTEGYAAEDDAAAVVNRNEFVAGALAAALAARGGAK